MGTHPVKHPLPDGTVLVHVPTRTVRVIKSRKGRTQRLPGYWLVDTVGMAQGGLADNVLEEGDDWQTVDQLLDTIDALRPPF